MMTMIQPGEKVTTVEFKINFLTPVTEDEMIGEARIIKKGKRFALADMEVKTGDGKLIAKGLATYIILSPPRGEKKKKTTPASPKAVINKG
jgi:uncharacterized protein (TIGR00369 family)